MFWLLSNKIRLPLFLLMAVFFLWKSTVPITFPIFLVIAGGMMNFVVCSKNGWKIPVRRIEGHTILNEKNGKYMTKKEASCYWMGDIHKIGNRMVSKGDFLIFGGIILGLIRFI